MDTLKVKGSKPLTFLKDGTLPSAYKVDSSRLELPIELEYSLDDSWDWRGVLSNFLIKNAYAYWTTQNPSLIETGTVEGSGDSTIEYVAFKDMDAFRSFVALKSFGGVLTKEAKAQAADAVAKQMKADGRPAKQIKQVVKLIKEHSTMSAVYELNMDKPQWVQGIIKYLEDSKQYNVLRNWKAGLSYKPSSKLSKELDDTF